MTVYFLGAGNMASAIIAGMCRSGDFEICAVDRHAGKLAELAERYAVRTATELPRLDSNDVLVLAVKPQDMRQALQNIRSGGALVLSVAAGLTCDALSVWLDGTRRIVRAMPNTPAQVGQGVTGLFADSGISVADRELADRIMCASGQTLWLESEDGLHRITGISGSGPAYVFYLLDALQAAACQQGFDVEQARQMTLATFKGAVLLAEQSGEDFALLQQKVTSRGGTTHEAIRTFEQHGVAAAVAAGVKACVARSQELAEQLVK